jgi:hypothetical protein
LGGKEAIMKKLARLSKTGGTEKTAAESEPSQHEKAVAAPRKRAKTLASEPKKAHNLKIPEGLWFRLKIHTVMHKTDASKVVCELLEKHLPIIEIQDVEG